MGANPNLMKLVSSDDYFFYINQAWAKKMAKLVGHITEGDKGARVIEMKNVEGQVLCLVVEYIKHHKGQIPGPIAKPIASDQISTIVGDCQDAVCINDKSSPCPWSAEFIKQDFRTITWSKDEDVPDLEKCDESECSKVFPQGQLCSAHPKVKPIPAFTPELMKTFRANWGEMVQKKATFLANKKQFDPAVTFKTILGANYMDAKELIHLGIARFATIVKSMSPDEIKKILATDTAEQKADEAQKGRAEQDQKDDLVNMLRDAAVALDA